ncbi:MAG TPA: aminotransferase class V-fold PLP-dependent enzyme [Phycisphaerae bacterium]|nr:aminotransferase class V-fold PLP-dependent enzyme [Phycisphaerae bacterium]HPS53361.1 aminotransferase class V-fold PLP-dependent enzyme [Phycisphaerae bacterium]
MRRIYMDNSATSFPKPSSVLQTMIDFAENCGASAGRGAYAEAKHCEKILATCRARIAKLINAESPQTIVFTLNCSDGLNIAIRGVLNTAPAGSHAITTALDHNSVLRPFNALAEQTGLQPQFIECDSVTGLVDPDDIKKALRPSTRLIACVHVSNVTGTMQPIDDVVKIAREAGVTSIVDAAQSIGHTPIDVQSLGADFVAFPGHKGLLGPLGTGVLYVKPGSEKNCPTMKEGGTGTVSELATHPQTMPDKYEVGSHNAIGIAGLDAGVAWLLEKGVDKLRAHDRRLCEVFLKATDGVKNLKVYGPPLTHLDCRAGVFSVNAGDMTPHELADELEKKYGILTRPGVHCAPLAHKTIGTHPVGTCRLSFGAFTTEEDVIFAAESLSKIANSL